MAHAGAGRLGPITDEPAHGGRPSRDEAAAPLEVFLTDPAVPIDTNYLERTLRPIPVRRKNWLFCWTEVGAEKARIIYRLITTRVLQEVDPHTYPVDGLQRIAIHPQREIEDLTPRLWKEKSAEQAMPSPAPTG